MNPLLNLWQRVTKLGLILTVGLITSACASTTQWKEEVTLHDGQVIVLERFSNLGAYPAIESHNRSPLDETITFTLPKSGKTISWRTEYRDERPEPNSLGALLLDVVDGVPYIATSPAGCIAYNKWGRPNPPYVLFKYVNDEWKRISLEQFPRALVQANLMSRPDSRILKPYYNVAAAKEMRESGNRIDYAKTILRDALPTSRLCPEWVYFEGNWVSPSYIESKKRYQQLILKEQEEKKRATDQDTKNSAE